MIFATVGTQLPFDRLLSDLNRWAETCPGVEVQAQTGRSLGDFPNLSCARFLQPAAFSHAIGAAQVIVSHAGMGSILTAAELGKPIVIMPRRAALGEHRTDHQLHTAAEMARLPNVTVAHDDIELAEALNRLVAAGDGPTAAAKPMPAVASRDLLGAVAGFIHGRAA